MLTRALLAFAFAFAALAQNNAVFPNKIPTNLDLATASHRASTTLSAAIDSDDTAISVASTASFTVPTGGSALIVIDNEVIKVCSKTSTVFTVCASGRAFDDTTAASHASGATAYGYLSKHHINQLNAEVKALAVELADNRAYNFAAQAPGGTLTASQAATVTLTPCPLGVAGANTTHYLYISAGTGTAEAVLITGGTCTSGAATGTIIFTPANNHSGAWTVSSATAGIQEALKVVNRIFVYPGTYVTYATITLASNQAVIGVPGSSIIKPTIASGTIYALYASGTSTARTTVSADVNGDAAGRASNTTDTIAVVSAANLTAGDYLSLRYTGNAISSYRQIVRIESITDLDITFYESVNIPMDSAESNTVLELVPAANITIDGLVFDASDSTGGAVSGVYLQAYRDSTLRNLHFIGFTQGTTSGGLVTSDGYHNTFDNITAEDCGTVNQGSIHLYFETNASGTSLSAVRGQFGVLIQGAVNSNFVNLTSNANATRGVRVSNSAWSNFTNIVANNNSTGLAIAWDTYRCNFRNVIATNNGGVGSGGVWFDNTGNEYNTVDGVHVEDNNIGVIIYPDDHDNVVRNVSGGDALLNLGTNNTITPATQFRVSAYNDAAQSVNNDSATALTFNTEDWDIGGLHSIASNTSRFTVPTGDVGSTGTYPQGSDYLVIAQATFATDSDGYRQLYIVKNGATTLASVIDAAFDTNTSVLQVSAVVNLCPTDYVEAFAHHTAGAALNVNAGAGTTFVKMIRLQ